jgi:hypothetical protein
VGDIIVNFYCKRNMTLEEAINQDIDKAIMIGNAMGIGAELEAINEAFWHEEICQSCGDYPREEGGTKCRYCL